MKNVGHLEYFTAIWYILWPFGNAVVIWYIFTIFGYIVSRKIWQPCFRLAVSQSREPKYDHYVFRDTALVVYKHT
jgi:hypothetical protein